MTSTERNQLIESYGQAYQLLTNAISRYPQEMWQWKPAPEKWSIHEVIIHITDSEVNSYVRCRRFIAEPGSGVYGYDENKWDQALGYHQQSVDEALELFKLLRRSSYLLIKDLPDDIWQTATVQHSENGLVHFEEWLSTYEEHIPVHIRQMERNYQAWLAVK